jgi:MFS transporter, FSR family, fosmidomycin resistance protein
MSFDFTKKRELIKNLTVYGLSHAAIDASCAAVAFSLLSSKSITDEYFIQLVIIYNVIAFGSQTLFGLLVDKYRCPKLSAISGSIITSSSILVSFLSPLYAIILAGIGNALFHIGGGIISLNLTKNRAAAPGIFVAPGALGLLIGTLYGKSRSFTVWPLLIIIAIFCVLMYYTKHPEINYKTDEKVNTNYFESIILLLLVTIVARSVIGSVVVLPWKSNTFLLVILTSGIVLGKALGGIIGDKYGWQKVGVISLLISAPLLTFGAEIPYAAIPGMFLFNFTMPITLVAISNKLPGRPGFSFGLTTLALIIGVLPIYAGAGSFLSQRPVVFAMIISSTIFLYYALLLYLSSFRIRNFSLTIPKQ